MDEKITAFDDSQLAPSFLEEIEDIHDGNPRLFAPIRCP